MWELDCEESWALKTWCFWTVVLEKTLESPLDYKEIQSVHSKGDQSWIFFGRNDAKAETPVLWPPHAKSWLIGKDTEAGRDWEQEEKGMTEDEMAGWHHRLSGREFEWTPGDGDGQGGLGCCDSWGRKESDMTERLSWTELKSAFGFNTKNFSQRPKAYQNSKNMWKFHCKNTYTPALETVNILWAQYITYLYNFLPCSPSLFSLEYVSKSNCSCSIGI